MDEHGYKWSESNDFSLFSLLEKAFEMFKDINNPVCIMQLIVTCTYHIVLGYSFDSKHFGVAYHYGMGM